jgi:hypothetical protein
MTPDQEEALRLAIRANPDCAAALAARDCEEVARIMSAGRVRDNGVTIGPGSILEVYGEDMEGANLLLDHISTDPLFRHVNRLLDRGALRIGKPEVQALLTATVVVPGLMPKGLADKLFALGTGPDYLTSVQVAEALYHPNGEEK